MDYSKCYLYFSASKIPHIDDTCNGIMRRIFGRELSNKKKKRICRLIFQGLRNCDGYSYKLKPNKLKCIIKRRRK